MSIYTLDPQQPPEACILWFHGLGADAEDMRGLVQQMPTTPLALRHVFLDAPLRPVTINNGMVMRAWYDITGFTESAREDKEGILASEKIIRAAMETQIKEGFTGENLFLAGFSQGGAMALHTALHTPGKLGGVLALSAYLPIHTDCRPLLDIKTPFFLASGTKDTIVLPAWTQFAKQWLKKTGYNKVVFNEYPMEHSICYREIQDINLWIQQQIQGEK